MDSDPPLVQIYRRVFPGGGLTEQSFIVQKLDQWAVTRVAQTFPLSTLKDAVVGIDASYYLNLRLNGMPKEDPLKHALGGVPFALKQQIIDDIDALSDAGAKAIFIFNGLHHVNKPAPEYLEQESMKAADEAWRKYGSGDPSGVNNEFAKVKYPLQYLIRWFQHLLVKLEVEYLVAPYSSIAQLSYMERLSEQYLDCIWGSTDYFLFNIDKVITNIPVADNARGTSFIWISKSACEERLKVTPEYLRDAQLLLGTAFSPAFPTLASQGATSRGASITEALSLLNANGRNVLQLCHSYRDDPNVAAINYADAYKKAIMSVRHHIAIEQDGAVGPRNAEYAPNDIHDFVGFNLPPEVFFYLSRGIIGPEALDWLTHDHIDLSLPPGVIDSFAHRTLVFEQLNPIRAQALVIMSENLTNYYRHRKVRINTWGDQDRPDLTINMNEQPLLKDKISGWKVKDPLMQGIATDFSLLTCLQALKNEHFREQSVNLGKTAHAYPSLTSTNEVVANTFYRFLHIRGYVDEKHELTKWGHVLEIVLSKLEANKRADDIAILAVELMRFGLLNGTEGDGTQPSGSLNKPQNIRTSINLVSKVACLDRLPHRADGYVGPLNQRLLSFSWMITAIRSTLRILMESVLVSMFTGAEVERERSDWNEISARLPLRADQGCSLGLVAKTYFDQVSEEKDQSDEVREKIKSGQMREWFRNAKVKNLGKSVDHIHTIWSAVYAGSQAAGKENKSEKVFDEAQTVLHNIW